MFYESGATTVEQDPRVNRVFSLVQETIELVNTVAKEEESLDADTKLGELKSLMKGRLAHNEEHLDDESFKPTLQHDREIYRKYVLAHIGEAWGDSKLEYVSEKNDNELREILSGKNVTARIAPDHSPDAAFVPSIGSEINGRVSRVSSLLGRLSIDAGIDGIDEVDVYLFAEDENGLLTRQVDLVISD